MKKRKWLRRLVALMALGLLVLTALDSRLAVRHYVIDAPQIDASVRLAVLTDFHECDYGENGRKLIDAVRAEEPDAVLMVGDMFGDGGDYRYAAALMTALAEEYPCYYVTGNHEYWTNEIDRIVGVVRDSGVMVLSMDSALLDVRGQQVRICGVPDPYAMYYSGAPSTQEQLRRAAQETSPEVFSLLMAHRPELIGQYAEHGFDLVLSGHAHGGQIRIPLIANGLYAPNQGFLPEYAGGQYRVQDTTLIVSRGLSTQAQWYIPRVFNRPELVVVELQ